MAWFKGLLGGMAGAFGYSTVSQYDTKDVAQGVLGLLARDGSNVRTSSPSIDPQISEVAKQLRELQIQLHSSRQQPLTIVTGHSSRQGWGYIVVPTSMLGLVLLYLRFVKGWSITDLMYVTRGSLHNLKASITDMQANMSANIAKMQEEVAAKTRQLRQQLGMVDKKQDELLHQQEALDGKLELLGDEMDYKMGQIGEDVNNIKGSMDGVNQQLTLTSQGMYVLCHAMADICRSVNYNGKSVAAIETFLRTAGGSLPAAPAAAAAAPANTPMLQGVPRAVGLEGLLTITEDDALRPSTSTPSSSTASPVPSPSAGSTSRNARSKSDSTPSAAPPSTSYLPNIFGRSSSGRMAAPRATSLPM